MRKIDIHLVIQDNELDGTVSVSNGAETSDLPKVKATKEDHTFNLSIPVHLPEERNVSRLLALGLFYPAILGYFIFEIFRGLSAINEFPGILPALRGHPSVWICKVILVAGTLCFYCCDFVNSMFAKKYALDSLLIDFLIMMVVVVCFNSLQLSPDDSKEFLPGYFNACYALFMLFYLIRFTFINPKMEKSEKLWYTMIGLLQVKLLILFSTLSVLNFLFYTSCTTWPLWLSCAAVIFSCALYINVIMARYKLRKPWWPVGGKWG
jgi:hypothetical protein